MVLPRWLTGRSEVESGNATTQELKTAIARALADPTRENILVSLDAEHKATPSVAERCCAVRQPISSCDIASW